MQFTNNDLKDDYRDTLEENIFVAMELMKMGYTEVMSMPVGRLKSLVKWKTDLEDKKQKALQKVKDNK